MKLTFEELREIPLRIINDLQHIKMEEEKQKGRLNTYTLKEKYIADEYKQLEERIKIWNEE